MANETSPTAPVDEPATAPAGEPATAPAREPDIIDVKLADIDWENSPQVREEIDEETVKRYAELLAEGATFPPVVIFRDSGRRAPFLLADGFHRARAYEKLERDVIPARVYAASAEKAQWYALGANREHGLRLGAGDLRRAVEMAFMREPLPSQRMIASHVGCSQTYVGLIRREQVNSGVHLPRTTVGADGKRYRASRKSRKASSRQSDVPPTSSSTPPTPTPAAEASGPVEPAGEETPPLLPPMPETTSASAPAGDAAPPVREPLDGNLVVAKLARTVAGVGEVTELVDFNALDRAQVPIWIEELRSGQGPLADVIGCLEVLVQSDS